MKEINNVEDLKSELLNYVFIPLQAFSHNFPGVSYQCNCVEGSHPVSKQTKIACIKGRSKFILMCWRGYISFVIPPFMPFVTKAKVDWSCERHLLSKSIETMEVKINNIDVKLFNSKDKKSATTHHLYGPYFDQALTDPITIKFSEL